MEEGINVVVTSKDNGERTTITSRDSARGCSSVESDCKVDLPSLSREVEKDRRKSTLATVKGVSEEQAELTGNTSITGYREQIKRRRNTTEDQKLPIVVGRNAVEIEKKNLLVNNLAGIDKKTKVTRSVAEVKNQTEVGSTVEELPSTTKAIIHNLVCKRKRSSRLQLKRIKKSSVPVRDNTSEVKYKNKNESALRLISRTSLCGVDEASMRIHNIKKRGLSQNTEISISDEGAKTCERTRELLGDDVDEDISKLTEGPLESREPLHTYDGSLQQTPLEQEAPHHHALTCGTPQARSNSISQASSIKLKSESTPASTVEELSEDSLNEYKNKTSGHRCIKVEQSPYMIKSSNKCEEEFGSIQEDCGAEDNIVMVPSTPQEKAARRLARERQLKNMRAREMAETRRERALRRRRRMNEGDEESDSKQEHKTWKKIKWKDDNELVSVFQYSPAEESSD